jgi:glucose-fructose oxidoreductase
VDQHSITIVRYDIANSGLSKFETRWGTFTDPWTNQPQPKCGFVLVGRNGTISTYDYEKQIRVQTLGRPLNGCVGRSLLRGVLGPSRERADVGGR